MSNSRTARFRFQTCLVLLLLSVAVGRRAEAQAPAGYSEYFIPGYEDDMLSVLCSQGTSACGTTTHAVISVAAWSDSTTVYYDHWENGYNFDPANPATADETYSLNQGGVQVFESPDIATPRSASVTEYDGRDRIYVAGGPVTVSRVGWLETRGVGLQGVAWEIYPVKPQLTTYVVPFGETSGWFGFQRIAALIQATRDNTRVTVDLNHDGTPDNILVGGVSQAYVDLNAGESFVLNDTSAQVAAGTLPPGIVITGSDTLQLKYITGRTDINNCTRGFSAFPRGFWTKDYYAPLNQPGTDDNGQASDTDYYLYNPNSAPITIDWQGRTTSGSFSIPATSVVSFRTASATSVPTDSGLYLKGSDVFWGVGSNDANGGGGTRGYAHEWGFSLLPSTLLYKEHYIGWAPNGDPVAAGNDEMGIFVTPAQDNTRVFVDYDNNGTVDAQYTLDRLQTRYITDPNDGDLQGARVWATGLFNMAYGQNSDVSGNSTPALDLGYIAIPATDFVSLVLGVTKTANPVVVSTASGSSTEFTLTVRSQGYPLDAVAVLDQLDANWAYTAGSTIITLPNLSTITTDPAVTASGTGSCPSGRGPCLTWSSSVLGSMLENQQIVIRFRAQTTAVLVAGTLSRNDVTATGTRTVGGLSQTFNATDFAYNVAGDLQITKTSTAAAPAYPGDTFTYTTAVTNPGAPTATGVNQTNVSLLDQLPNGVSYVGPTTLTQTQAYVADAFGAAAYNNSDGRNGWASNWTETDSSGGGATGGKAWITGGQLQFRNLRTGNSADDFASGGYAGSTGSLAWSAAWNETDGYTPGPAGATGGYAWVTGGQLQFRDLTLNAADAFNNNNVYTGSTGNVAWVGNWSETDISTNTAGAGAGFVRVANNALRFQFQATNVADNFTTANGYGNNNGNTNFTANWAETGDDGTAAGGNITVATNRANFSACAAAGCEIRRAAAVSGGSATIAFALANVSLGTGEYLQADYSLDGGANWVGMQRVTAGGTTSTPPGGCGNPCIVSTAGATTLTIRVWETTLWAAGHGARFDTLNIVMSDAVGSAAQRSVNLSAQAASAAVLGFTYPSAGLTTSDTVQVQVSSSASGPWTTFGTFTAGVPDFAPPYDLTPFISSTTTVRFVVTSGFDAATKTFNVDNVSIDIRNAPGTAVQRSVNLSGAGAASAALSFSYSAAGLTGTDAVQVQAASAAGGPWTTLATFTAGLPDVPPPYTLTSFVSTATTIRFVVASGLDATTKTFNIANVNIDYGSGSAAGSAIVRTANLTAPGATNPTLRFDYTPVALAAADTVQVQACGAGCGTPPTNFTTLATFTGGVPDVAPPYDLTPFRTATATIRFVVASGIDATSKTFSIDNVMIGSNVALTASVPPDLASSSAGITLRPFEILTSTIGVRFDNPFPAGQTSVTNTAATTTALFPVQLIASRIDTVVNPDSNSATVAGRLWLDADGGADQDLGEPGIDNVTVTLKDRFGTPLASTVTDANGRFLFTSVTPGTGYYVQATAPPDPGGAPLANLTQSFPTSGNRACTYCTISFDLAAGQSYTQADEGYAPTASTVSFGDLTWVDANANNVRDPGEGTLGGVTVRLYRDDGNNSLNPLLDTFVPVPTTGPGTVSVTSGSATVTGVGTSFRTLGAGDPITIAGTTYTILSVASATSLTLSTTASATASAVSYQALSIPGPGTVTVAAGTLNQVTGTGTSFLSLAAGDPIEIGGVKYKIQSVNSNTSLTLTANAVATAGVAYGIPRPTVSASDGSYLFTGITPASGTYFVSATTPAGYLSTGATNYMFTSVTGGTAYLTADFGFRSTGTTYTLKDRVFRDANANGTFDGGSESGIAGVTVDLLNSSGAVIATTTTGSDGTFTFSGLPGGGADYTTRITDTAGVLASFYGTTSYATAGQRSEPNLTADRDRSTSGPSYGYDATRAIGDTVYNDLNGNGAQDGGEPGIAGVVVRLHRDRNANGQIDVANPGLGTVSIANGSSTLTGTGTTFLNYRAGEPITINGVGYTIASVASNTSLTLTTSYAGANYSGASYAGNPLGGGTSITATQNLNTVTGVGTTFTNYRAGDPITINGNVYTIQAVASNTSLTLTTNYSQTTYTGTNYSGPPVFTASVTTDANGQYLFPGLVNGSYVVSVQTPTGYNYIAGARPDADGGTLGIQLAATISGIGNVLDRDFGFQGQAPATISGTLWNDADGSGVGPGAGENGIAGVTLDILDANGVVVRTVATDASGNYSVSGLACPTSCSYTVRVTDTSGVLTGYSATWEYNGVVPPGTDGQAPVSTSAGQTVNGVNFGFRRPTPTYAAISSFRAWSAGGEVVVEWRTTLEVGTVGFDLYRFDREERGWVKANESLLPALPGHPGGGTYTFVDAGAPTSGPLAYKLVEVDARADRRAYGPWRFAGLPDGPRAAEAYRRTPAEVPAVERERLALLSREREAALVARSGMKGERVKATTREAGLHYVDTAVLASLLGEKMQSLEGRVASGRVALENLGETVPYAPAPGGTGLYFYAEEIESPYTNENAYWIAARRGSTMAATSGAPTFASPAATFTDTVRAEVDRYPLPVYFQDPEADFYTWDYLYAGYAPDDVRSFTTTLRGVAGTGVPTLTVRLQGGSDTDAPNEHRVAIGWNGRDLGDVVWDGLVPKVATFPLGPGDVVEGTNTLVVTAILEPGLGFDVVYVDSFEVTYPRLFRAVADELSFSLPAGAEAVVTGFTSASAALFDVTAPESPRQVIGAIATPAGDGSWSLRFANRRGTAGTYLALVPARAKSPVSLTPGRPFRLADRSNGADYLLVAPPSLAAAAESLAAYRRTKGVDTQVVDLEDVYDEFGFGLATPVALQDLLAHAAAEWSKPPQFVTLVGRGTFDYMDVQGLGDNLVPTLLASTPYGLAASDVSYAPLSTSAGPGLKAIGRLPVLTSQELLDYLAKVQTHEAAPAGAWQTTLLMTADDPDAGGAFPTDSDTVAAVAPATFLKSKVYLGAYSVPDARAAILGTIGSGAVLLNFIGHGSPDRLAAEGILAKADVPTLTNAGRLPVFLAMTCSAGNFAIPGFPSLSESLVLWKSGGAYVAWAPSGLSLNDGARTMNEAFFQSAFQDGEKVVGRSCTRSLEALPATGPYGYMKAIYNLIGEPVSRLP